MIETLKKLLVHQYEAALCTLNLCIDRCPDDAWDKPVGNQPLSQVVFHTLFFADFYLGPDDNVATFKDQPFHRENEAFFDDYEQLEYREPVSVYTRDDIKRYMQHCRDKMAAVIASETAESFSEPTRFARRDFSRAELHVYNTRHIQHHAAQISLRLRISADQNIPWVGYGWRDVG